MIRFVAVGTVLCLGVAGALAAPVPAAAQGGPAVTAPSDAAYEAAKAAFEALPEAERKAVQEALVWTGDHTGVTTGGFGRRSFEAIQVYQRRHHLKADGILDGKARAALEAAAQKAREAVKFAVATDAKTGVKLGVPERLVPKRSANPFGGSRWQSADGKITLDTRLVAPAEGDLAALYEKTVAAQAPGRRVAYKVLRPDFFVVSGETATGKFYIRYGAGPGGLRGFSLAYDKSVRDFDRIVIAVANSFVPFPGAATTAARSEPAAGAGAATTVAPPPRPAAIEPPRPPSLIATGLRLSPHQIVTTAAVETCPDLRIGGAKATVAKSDSAAGLALLNLGGDRSGATVALAGGAPAAGEAVVILSFAGGDKPVLSVTPGAWSGADRVVAPVQPGGAGGAILDRTGALVGLVGALPPAPRMIAGVVPPITVAAVGREALARLATEAGSTLPPASGGPERSAGAIAAALAPSLVAILCAR